MYRTVFHQRTGTVFVLATTCHQRCKSASPVPLLKDDLMVALKTGRHVANFAVETALVTGCLLALFTVGIMFAVVAECLVALVTDEHIFTLNTEFRLAHFTDETVFTLTAEISEARVAAVERFAVHAEFLLALGTVKHFFAMKTQ
jgi:hypothetical protein